MAVVDHRHYDEIADWYADWVQTTSWAHGVIASELVALCRPVDQQRLLDVACGEGTFSRLLGRAGHEVVGVDVSTKLIAIARERSKDTDDSLKFVVDDARTLATCPDAAFDGAICVMALMDIPDLGAVYRSVRRVVRSGGWFVIAITHPCFDSPHADWIETDDGSARLVRHYLDEGSWRSRYAEGVRGKVGAYHRTISTYLNEAIAGGWALERLVEPAGGPPGQTPLIPRLVLARFRAVL
jgi:ubiquinone/menaquinone biosynthesis C-methylase UbiE